MLTLRFHSPSELTLGPSRSFTIEGTFIRQSPHNEIVCRCTTHGWHLEDETARSFECADRSHVQFEDAQGRTSPVYGPFGKLHFTDDRCFADDGLFAEFLPDRQQWRHVESGVRWRILTVKARD